MYVYLSLALQDLGRGVSLSDTLGYRRTNFSTFGLGIEASTAIALPN